MRNLKRALSLTLASVMLLGMMVVGSSAAASYPDVDSNDNVEAIEVLQAVKVMQGNADNGNFEPDRSVTRAEMAVVMANLLNLDYDYYESTCPFTDVPAWARPYVGACYANKIVAGYSATTYGPNDSVTPVQAAAMMMRALGYFQYASDYEDGFETATVRQGSRIGIFSGVGSSATAAMTRNQVAQLTLNALQCTMVDAHKTSADITVGSGDTAVSINGAVEYIVRTSANNDKMSTAIKSGVQTGSGTDGVYGETIELGEQLYQGDLVKKTSDDGVTDAFGAPASRWTYKNVEIGTYADEADAVYTSEVKSKDIYSDLGLSATVPTERLTITEDGKTYSAPDGDHTVASIAKSGDAGDKKLGGNGVLVKAYKGTNNDNEVTVTISMINTYLTQVDGAYNADNKELDLEALNGTKAIPSAVDTTLSADDFGGLSNFSDGEYVLVTVGSLDKGSTQEIMTIASAETLTGEVSKYTKDEEVTVDGTPYKYNKGSFHNNADSTALADIEYEIGKSSKFILDTYGYIIGIDELNGGSSYVYINEFADDGKYTKNKTFYGDAYFADGTTDDITLNKIDNKEIKSVVEATATLDGGSASTGWFKYTTNSKGEYNLTSVSNVGGDAIKSDGTKVVENGETKVVYNTALDFKRANNSTVFIFKDGKDVYWCTGIKDAATVTATGTNDSTKVKLAYEGSYATYVFVDVGDGDLKGASKASGDIIFILKAQDHKTKKDSNGEYYTYDAIVNGKKTTIDSNDESVFGTTTADNGLYVEVYYDENGLVDDAALVDKDDSAFYFATNGAFDEDWGVEAIEEENVTQKGQTIIFGTSDTDPSLHLANDGFIRLIDGTDVTSMSPSNLANEFKTETFTGYVWATFKDGDATGVYVEKNADAADGSENGDPTALNIEIHIDDKEISRRDLPQGNILSDGSTVDTRAKAASVIGTWKVTKIAKDGKPTIEIKFNESYEVPETVTLSVTQDGGSVVTNATVDADAKGEATVVGTTAVETVNTGNATVEGDTIKKVEYSYANNAKTGDEIELIDDQGNLVGTVELTVGDKGAVSAVVKDAEDKTVKPTEAEVNGKSATVNPDTGAITGGGEAQAPAATTYGVTNLASTVIKDSTATKKNFTITAENSRYEKEAEVNLTITLDENVPANKKVTVTITAPEGIDPVVIAAGAKTATTKFTMPEKAVEIKATAEETSATATVDKDPTANVTFELTTPKADEDNTLTGGGATKTVGVTVAKGTESVVITATKTKDQTVTVGGKDEASVKAEGTDTAPTYTVDTKSGNKEFTLVVSEEGKESITYTVTVTVSNGEGGGDETTIKAPTVKTTAGTDEVDGDAGEEATAKVDLSSVIEAFTTAYKENSEKGSHKVGETTYYWGEDEVTDATKLEGDNEEGILAAFKDELVNGIPSGWTGDWNKDTATQLDLTAENVGKVESADAPAVAGVTGTLVKEGKDKVDAADAAAPKAEIDFKDLTGANLKGVTVTVGTKVFEFVLTGGTASEENVKVEVGGEDAAAALATALNTAVNGAKIEKITATADGTVVTITTSDTGKDVQLAVTAAAPKAEA